MATADSSSTHFCVTGAPPPPRARPRKLTNSEKTKTTSNLSQHKYLTIKRQLQLETERKLLAARNSGICRSSAGKTEYTRQIPGVYQYRVVTDCEGELHTSYNNDTNLQQQRFPSSGQSLRATTTYATTAAVEAGSTESHVKQSDLRKLLTSIRLTPQPQVPANPRNSTLSNLQHLQSSSTSLISDEDSLSQLVDIVTPDCSSSGGKECSLRCLQMTFSESSATDLPYTGRESNGSASDMEPKKTSWYNDHLRTTLNGLHIRRNRTKSAPGGSRLHRSRQRLDSDVSPMNITYLSSDTPQRPSTSRDGRRSPTKHGVELRGPRAEKTDLGDMFNKKPSLFYSNPVPRSRWYEMKTPEFHVEAKRNNDFIKKVCNC